MEPLQINPQDTHPGGEETKTTPMQISNGSNIPDPESDVVRFSRGYFIPLEALSLTSALGTAVLQLLRWLDSPRCSLIHLLRKSGTSSCCAGPASPTTTEASGRSGHLHFPVDSPSENILRCFCGRSNQIALLAFIPPEETFEEAAVTLQHVARFITITMLLETSEKPAESGKEAATEDQHQRRKERRVTGSTTDVTTHVCFSLGLSLQQAVELARATTVSTENVSSSSLLPPVTLVWLSGVVGDCRSLLANATPTTTSSSVVLPIQRVCLHTHNDEFPSSLPHAIGENNAASLWVMVISDNNDGIDDENVPPLVVLSSLQTTLGERALAEKTASTSRCENDDTPTTNLTPIAALLTHTGDVLPVITRFVSARTASSVEFPPTGSGYPTSPLFCSIALSLWGFAKLIQATAATSDASHLRTAVLKSPLLSMPEVGILHDEADLVTQVADEIVGLLLSQSPTITATSSHTRQQDSGDTTNRCQLITAFAQSASTLLLARCLSCRLTVGTLGAVRILGVFPPGPSLLVEAFCAKHRSREKLSVGARALSKHIHRDQSSQWWGGLSMKGSQEKQNEHALRVLSRLVDGCTWLNLHMLPHSIPVVEIRVQEGYGARWAASHDGNAEWNWMFRGFLEPHEQDGHSKGWVH